MSVNTYEIGTTTICGRPVGFDDDKKIYAWLRLHKKKCDQCRNATFQRFDIVVQHDWSNRNDVEREVSRGNATYETSTRLTGGIPSPPKTI